MSQIGGVGHHVVAVPIHTFQIWLQLSKVLEFTYTPAVMFAKLAALFLYYRVFEVPFYRRIIVGIGVIIVLQGIIALILAFSICRPFRYFWTQAVDVNDGTCGDVMLFYKSYSIPSLVTDVAMLVLPWPILAKLHIPTAEKLGLIFTFLAASLCVIPLLFFPFHPATMTAKQTTDREEYRGIITCTLRFVTFFTTPLFSDPTWYASGGPMIYALVEPSIYMIASILPTTRHLYRRLRNKARLTAQMRSEKCDSPPDNRSSSRSADEEARQSRETTDGAAQAVEGWGTNRLSSQEELMLGQLYGEEKPDAGPREMVRTKIEMRDRGKPTL